MCTNHPPLFIASLTCTCTHTVPPDAISATVNRTGRPVAGSEFTLGCIVEAVSGFTEMPTAEWRDADGRTVVTGGDITIQTSLGSRVTVTTLTFNPVKAADVGRYTCIGSLMTPVQPAPLQDSVMEDLQVQSKQLHHITAHPHDDMSLCAVVSTPVVTLSLAPDSPVVAGGVGDTVLTCTAVVDRAVVNRGTLEYAFTWRDRDSNTIVSGGRTILSNTAPSPSQSSNLTLSPLSIADTSFTCAVVVTVMEDTLVPSETGETSTAVSVISESSV